MISVEYVPNLTSAEEESHKRFEGAFESASQSLPAYGWEADWKLKQFAAAIWAAAFKRAEEVLAQEK